MWIFCSGAVGKGKLFWFFSVGFVCRQKPNVLDRALAFYTDAQRSANMRSCRRELATRGNFDGAEGGISYSLLSDVLHIL